MGTSLRLPLRWGPLAGFGLVAVLLVAVEHTIVHRADVSRHPSLSLAVAADLLLVLPGLFYVCVVRRYQLPLSTIAAAVSGGLALIHWLLPAGGLPLLAWVGRLVGLVEVGIIGYMAVRLRQVMRAYRISRQQSADFLEALVLAAQPVLGRLTEVVTTEIALLRYACLGAWAKPEVAPGEGAFSMHQKSGFVALLATFGGLMVLEMTAAHLVVGHWFPRAAWGLTLLSLYSVVWLLAHGQAVRCRPVLLTATTLVVRVGFLWRVSIARERVVAVKQVHDLPAPAPGLFNAARLVLAPPNLLLTLAEPQVVRGPYGLRRLVNRLAIYVDEPVALRQQLG